MIRTIEELSFDAWPALETIHYDGWVLQFSNGFTKRANSVNPLYDSTIDPNEKIDYCEALYRGKGLKIIFKLTDISRPRNLDETLSRKGYEIHDPVSVQVLELQDIPDPPFGDCEIYDRATDVWLDAYCAMDNRAANNRATLKSMLEAIVPLKAFVALRDEDRIVACGMAVLDKGFAGLFNIIVKETHRNRGCGRRLLSNLLGWAKNNGAHAAYLQVLKINAAANRIYREFGFQEVSAYWYRIKG